jgi:hypothetical protein
MSGIGFEIAPVLVLISLREGQLRRLEAERGGARPKRIALQRPEGSAKLAARPPSGSRSARRRCGT